VEPFFATGFKMKMEEIQNQLQIKWIKVIRQFSELKWDLKSVKIYINYYFLKLSLIA